MLPGDLCERLSGLIACFLWASVVIYGSNMGKFATWHEWQPAPVNGGAEKIVIAFVGSVKSNWGTFQKCSESIQALKNLPLWKIHIFQYMGKMFYVEFQRLPLKFHIQISYPYIE